MKLFRSDGRKCTGQILARKKFLRSDGRNWDEFQQQRNFQCDGRAEDEFYEWAYEGIFTVDRRLGLV